jgi:two-component system chemotaxis response regulator CheY
VRSPALLATYGISNPGVTELVPGDSEPQRRVPAAPPFAIDAVEVRRGADALGGSQARSRAYSRTVRGAIHASDSNPGTAPPRRRAFFPENLLLESRGDEVRTGWETGLKVLLVDDSAISRKLQLKVLQELGLKDVVEAKNGVEALRKLEETSFSCELIVTDWNMPVMDGVTFIRELRKTQKGRHVPVIVVSSEGEHDKISSAFEAGADSYVTKPFKTEVLARKIESVKNVALLSKKNPQAFADATLSGDLATLGFAELVQFLNFSKKTGELIVRLDVGEAGVSFESGEVLDAWIGRFASEEAFFAIARLRKGRFDFHEGRSPRPKRTKHGTLALLMEAMRLVDESDVS